MGRGFTVSALSHKAEAQAVLAQFGYRLEQVDDVYWRLLQGETLLTDTVRRGYGPFHQVNRSGTDFWMLLSVERHAQVLAAAQRRL